MISLLTHGWICYGNKTIINRYVLPYNLKIKNNSCIDLTITDKNKFSLNLSNILNKCLNLKITESQINLKSNNDDNSLNINKE